MGAHEHDHSYNCGCSYCVREAQLRVAVRRAEKLLAEVERAACDALLASGGAWTEQITEHRERVFSARKTVEEAKQALRDG